MKFLPKNNKKSVFFLEIVFIFLVLFSLYTLSTSQIDNTREVSELELQIQLRDTLAKEFCSQLISSPGVSTSGSNWGSLENVAILGLKEFNSPLISINKLAQIETIDFRRKQELNLDRFQIDIRNFSDASNTLLVRTPHPVINSSNNLRFPRAQCFGISSEGDSLLFEVRVQ